MASALITGLVGSGTDPRSILVADRNRTQLDRLTGSVGVVPCEPADGRLAGIDTVVWAVKPQDLRGAIDIFMKALGSPLHVSIAAGVAASSLREWLGSERVVRAMPNTPALVGAGVTGLLCSASASPQDRASAHRLFAAAGTVFPVESDEQLDAITAISGSGPGYFFQFLACFQSAAESLGFTESQSRELALRTAAGSIEQALRDKAPLEILRDRVASPGGTTEAGLDVLSSGNLCGLVARTVTSAFDRARELSRQLSAGAPSADLNQP